MLTALLISMLIIADNEQEKIKSKETPDLYFIIIDGYNSEGRLLKVPCEQSTSMVDETTMVLDVQIENFLNMRLEAEFNSQDYLIQLNPDQGSLEGIKAIQFVPKERSRERPKTNGISFDVFFVKESFLAELEKYFEIRKSTRGFQLQKINPPKKNRESPRPKQLHIAPIDVA